MCSHSSVDSSARKPIALPRAVAMHDTIDDGLRSSNTQRSSASVGADSPIVTPSGSENVAIAMAVRHDRCDHAPPAYRSIERV